MSQLEKSNELKTTSRKTHTVTSQSGRRLSDDAIVPSRWTRFWKVDPLSGSGRLRQGLGVMMLPLVPSLPLLVYSAVLIAQAANSYNMALSVEQTITSNLRSLDVITSVLSEVDGTVMYVLANSSQLLGTLEQFYQETDISIDQMTVWPDNSTFGMWWLVSGDTLRIFLNSQRIVNDPEVGVDLYDLVNTYESVINLLDQWIARVGTMTSSDTVWISNLCYVNLVTAYAMMGAERTFGTAYYLMGHLPLDQYLLLERTRVQSTNRVQLVRDLEPQLDTLYVQMSDAKNDTDIAAARMVMLDNAQVAISVISGVVWNKRYSYYMTVVKTLLLDVGNEMQSLLYGLTSSSDTPYLAGYSSVALFILALLSPFALISGLSTIRTLRAYALLMVKKTMEIKREKRRTENLLNQMLPRFVAYRLKKGEFMDAEEYKSVTIFFSDIEDFADISARSLPMQIVGFLNDIYNLIDREIVKFDIYKVETIGSVYMVASGLPMRNGHRHVREIARFSLELLRGTEQFVIPHLPTRKLQLRMGMHSGPCVAGVVGNKMPRYCLFGDTVNTASRMQSNGQQRSWDGVRTLLARKIHITQTCHDALDAMGGFIIQSRGDIEIKGKGVMQTYWLLDMHKGHAHLSAAGSLTDHRHH